MPKTGDGAKLQAMKRRSKAVVAYGSIQMSGDHKVLRAVVAPYISADLAGRVGVDVYSIGPSEYLFKHWKTEARKGGMADVFIVKPKGNRLGQFSGELWIDLATGLPLRIAGQFIQPVSGPFRSVSIVRDYDSGHSGYGADSYTLTIGTSVLGRSVVQVSTTSCAVDAYSGAQ